VEFVYVVFFVGEIIFFPGKM